MTVEQLIELLKNMVKYLRSSCMKLKEEEERHKSLLKVLALKRLDINNSYYIKYIAENNNAYYIGPFVGQVTHIGNRFAYCTAYDRARLELTRQQKVEQCNVSGEFFCSDKSIKVEIVTEDSAIQKENK